MHLTVYTDYSLRVLMYLALKQGEPATIAEAAESLGVSRNHLMKVVFRLGQGGYLQTLRGKSGGFRLGRPVEQIGLGEVVRYTETGMDLVPCFASDEIVCRLQPECALRSALYAAREAFMEVLDGYSVADLASKRASLRRLLAIGQPPGRSPGCHRPSDSRSRSARAARKGSAARRADV